MTESRSGSSESKSKSDAKSSTKMKRNPLTLKSKIECLICSHKKNKMSCNKNNHLNQFNSNYYQCDYVDELHDYENNFDYGVDDVCRKNNLNFYDSSNYYKYHNNDIKDILNFPNINDSFISLESTENSSNKNLSAGFNSNFNKNPSTNSNRNLIDLDLVEQNVNDNSKREFNINKNNIKIKTLYSNEDISIKYNYILKKLI
jgi:hypothetical protein